MTNIDESLPDPLEIVGQDVERACYPGVVAGVRRLGQAAVDEFLEGFAPFADALARGDDGAERAMGWSIHEWGVTVGVIESAGGVEALNKSFDACDGRAGLSVDESIAKLDQQLAHIKAVE